MWSLISTLDLDHSRRVQTVAENTSGVTKGEGADWPKIIFLCLNLERTLDKRRGKMRVVRRRQLKRPSLSEAMTKKVAVRYFQEKKGDTLQLPPRVTPTQWRHWKTHLFADHGTLWHFSYDRHLEIMLLTYLLNYFLVHNCSASCD